MKSDKLQTSQGALAHEDPQNDQRPFPNRGRSPKIMQSTALHVKLQYSILDVSYAFQKNQKRIFQMTELNGGGGGGGRGIFSSIDYKGILDPVQNRVSNPIWNGGECQNRVNNPIWNGGGAKCHPPEGFCKTSQKRSPTKLYDF